MLSETMRLELAPLNVRVITLVAGGTKSNISDNGPPPESLPPTSQYLAVEKHIATNMDFKQTPTEIFAERVVDDVVRGATGKVWHGVGSKTVRYAVPLMPQWIFVSLNQRLITCRVLMMVRTRSCLRMDEDCSTCRSSPSRHVWRQCLHKYDQHHLDSSLSVSISFISRSIKISSMLGLRDSSDQNESRPSRVLMPSLNTGVPSKALIGFI
jgi:hypothetical protein